MKTIPQYKITKTKIWSPGDHSVYVYEGTLPELIKTFAYTLMRGAGYSHEKGRKKINQNPKTIGQLITNLTNASNNAAANGCSGLSYKFEKLIQITA